MCQGPARDSRKAGLESRPSGRGVRGALVCRQRTLAVSIPTSVAHLQALRPSPQGHCWEGRCEHMREGHSGHSAADRPGSWAGPGRRRVTQWAVPEQDTRSPTCTQGGFLGGDAIRVLKDEQVSARTTVQRSPGVPREAGKVGAVGRLEAGAEAAGERSACLVRI